MRKITIVLKSGGNCTLETNKTLSTLKREYRELFTPKSKKHWLELEDRDSVTIIPKDNVSMINLKEVAE